MRRRDLSLYKLSLVWTEYPAKQWILCHSIKLLQDTECSRIFAEHIAVPFGMKEVLKDEDPSSLENMILRAVLF